MPISFGHDEIMPISFGHDEIMPKYYKSNDYKVIYMEALQNLFPFIEKTYSKNGIIYFEGSMNGNSIILSCFGKQWILTIDHIHYVAVISDSPTGIPEEIVDAMLKIKNGLPVEPNKNALSIREILKTRPLKL